MERNEAISCCSFLVTVGLIITSLIHYIDVFCLDYRVMTGIICAAICTIPLFFYRYQLIRLPAWFVAMIYVAIFIHAFGVISRAYSDLSFYDTLTHAYSSFVVSICIVLTLFCLQKYNPDIKLSVKACSIFAILTMVSFGVIWEVFEFWMDKLIGTSMQLSPLDTLTDLINDSVGSLFCSLFMGWYMRNRSIGYLIDSLELHPALKRVLGDESIKDVKRGMGPKPR